MGSIDPAIFKAYDIRGLYPGQLDENAARRIGEAFAAIRRPKKVAVGRDVRGSGEVLKAQLIKALLAGGVSVVDIGTITTDQLYFAVGHYGLDGGISVTASHNPAEYNGFKFAEAGGGPISSEDLQALRDWTLSDANSPAASAGSLSALNILEDYVDHVLSYIDIAAVKPMRAVANANFGAVGQPMDRIAEKLGLRLERLNWQPDGSFPKGPPNPQLPENRQETAELIKLSRPDFGVAWDADADRCFFFSGEGEFIQSCFIIAILSQYFLEKYPGSKIVHDVSVAQVIDDVVTKAGGTPITHRTGHTFIKARMRQEDAPFAAESSGHYYFRDSFYADNGLVPVLLILQLLSQTGKSLKELVEPLMAEYKVSGELNFTVTDSRQSIQLLEEAFGPSGQIDRTDGLTVSDKGWRFNVRPSNTEPLLRLNAEAKDQQKLDNLVARIADRIKAKSI